MATCCAVRTLSPAAPKSNRGHPGDARRDQGIARTRGVGSTGADATDRGNRRLEITIAQATSAITALVDEQHRHEKDVVAHAAQLSRSDEESARLSRKREVIALERGRAEEERRTLEGRRAEAGVVHQPHRRGAAAGGRSPDRRAAAIGGCPGRGVATGRAAAEVRASRAALVERTTAMAAEVERLEEGARDLEHRISFRAAERDQAHSRRESLLTAVEESVKTLDADILSLDDMRQELRTADDAAAAVPRGSRRRMRCPRRAARPGRCALRCQRARSRPGHRGERPGAPGAELCRRACRHRSTTCLRKWSRWRRPGRRRRTRLQSRLRSQTRRRRKGKANTEGYVAPPPPRP